MEFFETIKLVKSNWQPYKVWELEQQKKEKQNEELRKKYPPTPKELEHAKQYGRTIVNVINTMDQHSIDKSEDASVALGYTLLPLDIALMAAGWGLGTLAGKQISKSKFGTKLANIKPFWGPIGFVLMQAIFLPIINIYQSKVTKQASRIARFQTRENDLKDSRHFVIYNDEQIKEAEKIADTLPEIKEKRQDKFTKNTFNPIESYNKTKKTVNELNKDDARYQQWKKEYQKTEEQKKELFKILNPSKEELSKAEKDRDVMLNTIKKIENNALEYYNNMEMASYVINSIICSVSMGIGLGISALFGVIQKNIKSLKNSKMANAIKIMPFIASTFAPLIALAPTNKLIKDAARIGRFKAKQELLNNPENFIAYDDEQKNTVSAQELPKKKSKGLVTRFKEDLLALKQLRKDAKEYKNYMNTEHKKELKLQEASKQIKISNEQKINAINLQRKAFQSFEKMDEKAQRFTDDTDAAVDSSRIIIGAAIALSVKLASIFISGKEITKINGNKVPEKFSEAFKIIFTKKLTGKAILGLLIPFFVPTFIKIPMVIKGVQIKKDAGKIGVMTAMQDLDDPKNFLDDKNS